jgi:hypothetical protein
MEKSMQQRLDDKMSIIDQAQVIVMATAYIRSDLREDTRADELNDPGINMSDRKGSSDTTPKR